MGAGQPIARVELQAYGKINLSLYLCGLRPDGYHEIDSFMQDIDLCDRVTVSRDGQNSPDYSCVIGSFHVNFSADADTIPLDGSNLAVRGAAAVLQAVSATADRAERPVTVCVEKHLPVAAGIAGGSGNAAAAMLGTNAVLGQPFSLQELCTMGAAVGADVPFSLMMNARKNRRQLEGLSGLERASVAAYTSGIGDVLRPATPLHRHVILANPGIAVSTGAAYAAADAGQRSAKSERALFHNDLEVYTLTAYPEAAALRARMAAELHAETLLMSGSGPTMVAYYRDGEQADRDARAAGNWLQAGWRIWRTESGRTDG